MRTGRARLTVPLPCLCADEARPLSFFEWEDVRRACYGHVIRRHGPPGEPLSAELQLRSLEEQWERHMWSKLDVDACEKALERWLRSDEPAPEHAVDMLRRCAAWHAHGERLLSVAEEYEDAVAQGAEDGSRLLLPDKMMAFLLDEANARDSLTARHLQLARHLVSYLPLEKRSNQCSVCRWALLNDDPAVRSGATVSPDF